MHCTKRQHVWAIEHSHHQALYQNRVEIFTREWLEISKPYRCCEIKIHNMHNVSRYLRE